MLSVKQKNYSLCDIIHQNTISNAQINMLDSVEARLGRNSAAPLLTLRKLCLIMHRHYYYRAMFWPSISATWRNLCTFVINAARISGTQERNVSFAGRRSRSIPILIAGLDFSLCSLVRWNKETILVHGITIYSNPDLDTQLMCWNKWKNYIVPMDIQQDSS